MEQIKLPNTNRVLKMFKEKVIKANILKERYDDVVDEIEAMHKTINDEKEKEGCFKRIMWDYSGDDIKIYVDFTDDDRGKNEGRNREQLDKDVYEYFKKKTAF